MESEIVANPENYCRTCLRAESAGFEKLQNIFDVDSATMSNTAYADMLKSFTHRDVNKDDKLPKKVCTFCIQQIRTTFNFKKYVDDNYEKLAKMFENETTADEIAPVVNSDALNASQTDTIIPYDEEAEAIYDFLNDLTKDKESNDTEPAQLTVPKMEVHKEEQQFVQQSEDLSDAVENVEQRSTPDSGINDDTGSEMAEKSERCSYCEDQVSQTMLDDHVKANHQENWAEFKLNGRKLDEARVSLEKFNSLNSTVYICVSCDRIFCSKGSYLSHSFDCVHECIDCQIDFKSQVNFTAHFKKQHNIDLEIVGSGVKTYTKDELIKSFMTINQTGRNGHCRACNMEFSNVLLHMYANHATIDPFKCSFCKEKFRSRQKREAHMSQAHAGKYRCEVCRTQFPKHNQLVTHMKMTHRRNTMVKKSPWETEDVSADQIDFVEKLPGFKPTEASPAKTTNSSENIVKVELKTNANVEESEGEMLTNEEFRKKYLTIKNSDRGYCKGCKSDFSSHNIMYHMKTKHAKIYSHLCALCEQGFHMPQSRDTHMRLKHPNDFKCVPCRRQYSTSLDYAEHMKKSHNHNVTIVEHKQVDVPLVDIRFGAKGIGGLSAAPSPIKKSTVAPADNVATTSSEPSQRPASNLSAAAEETYSRSEFFKKFMNIKGDKYRCKVCEKSGITPQYHVVNYHSVTLPFKCSFCLKRFAEGRARRKHATTVHRDGCYKCKFCNLFFVMHVDIVNHTKMEHNSFDIVEKSPHEEPDLTFNEVRFVTHPSRRQAAPDQNETISVPDDCAGGHFDDISEFLETSFQTGESKAEQNSSDIQNETIVRDDKQENNELDEIVAVYTFDDFNEKFVIGVSESHQKCVPCDNEILKNNMTKHIRNNHSKTPSYFCELCPESFLKYDHRLKHMKDVHTNDFQCEVCERQFYHSMKFKEHMVMNHTECVDIPTLKSFEEVDIPIEKIQFAEKSNRPAGARSARGFVPSGGQKRKRDEIEIDEFTCERFQKNFISTRKNGVTICTICSAKVTQKSLKSHMLERHAVTNFTFCEICDEGFNSEQKRKDHMTAEHSSKQKCVLCTVQYTKESTFLHHMKVEHNREFPSSNRTKIDNIQFEDVLFSDEHPMLRKMPTYEYDELVPDGIQMTKDQFYTKFIRNFKDDSSRTRCLACGETFNSSNKRTHIDVYHTQMKAFSCQVCSYQTNDKRSMKSHMSIKHPDDYKCIECNEQFIKAQEFVDHMKEKHKKTVDIEVPEDVADISPDSITYVKSLSELVSRSSDPNEGDEYIEEKFMCSFCNKEFSTARDLRTHLRLECLANPNSTITDEQDDEAEKKKYPCDQCDKIFYSGISLNGHRNGKHKRPAPGEMSQREIRKYKDPEYECDVCNEKSDTRSYILNHLRRSHGDEFNCGQCGSFSGSYLLSKFHLLSQHPTKVKLELSKRHKCPQCYRYFNEIDSLNDHVKNKHENAVSYENVFHCEACSLIHVDEFSFKTHCEQPKHIDKQKILDEEKDRFQTGAEETYAEIQDETEDAESPENSFIEPTNELIARTRRHSIFPQDFTPMLIIEHPTKTDEFSRTVKKERLEVEDESPVMMIKMEPPEEPQNSNIDSTSSNYEVARNDKGETYVNFMRMEGSEYKCLVCDATKPVRRNLLHHLKNHIEVPTFSCRHCSEKFLFKGKHDEHLKSHASDSLANDGAHLKCEICDVAFKYNLALNQHDTKWHSESNENRGKSMQEQKILNKSSSSAQASV